jgi:hypothetical protein
MARSSVREKNILLDSIDTVAAAMSVNSLGSVNEGSGEEAKEVVTIRQYFPETWLWSLELVDKDGLVVIKHKVPDTITDWVLDAYCLSNVSGLAVSPPKTLKVFQPLFTTINMPYSVVRGETFPVNATVFNYETSCVPVRVLKYTTYSLCVI